MSDQCESCGTWIQLIGRIEFRDLLRGDHVQMGPFWMEVGCDARPGPGRAGLVMVTHTPERCAAIRRRWMAPDLSDWDSPEDRAAYDQCSLCGLAGHVATECPMRGPIPD